MRKRMMIVVAAVWTCLTTAALADAQKTETSRQPSPIVRDIAIEIAGDPSREAGLYEMAENLIFLKKNEPFSQQLLLDSIGALELSKKFSDIHVDSEDVAGGIVVEFSLTPFRHVKRLDISGENPIFEQKIISQMTFYTGDAFVQSDLEEQRKLIRNLFLEEGFIDPKVDVRAEIDPEDGNAVVCIDIDPDAYLSLEDLRFSGNRGVSSSRLKTKMETWRASFFPGSRGRFIESDLKKDIEKLVKYYRSKHYPEVEISYELERDMENLDAAVHVIVSEGPYYDVQFEGNEEFWGLTLKKDLVIFEEGNPHNLGLKKAVRKIKERYREKGYLDTEIGIEEGKRVGEDGTEVREIKIVVAEGPRSIVENVRISGNAGVDDETVKEQLLTREPGIIHSGKYVPEILETDVNAVKTLYASEGYAEAEVSAEPATPEKPAVSEETKPVEIEVEIQEGPRTLVENVEIEGLHAVPEEEAYEAISLAPGEPFRSYMLKSDENALSTLVSPHGRPHVKVRSEVLFSENKSKATIVYKVDEGPFVQMGQTYLSGNLRTKDSVVEREIEMEPGEPFSLKRLLGGQKTIQDMEIFDSVKFKSIGLKEKADTVHTFVEMREKKPYYFQVGLGYQTDTGTYVNTRIGDRNFLGRNKHVWAGGSLSEIGYRAEAWYSEPRLFGSTIQTDFGIFAEKKEEFNKNFGTELYGASWGFSRKWTEHLSTGLAFRYEKRESYEIDAKEADEDLEIDEEEFRPRNVFVATPLVSYDTRDSNIRPRKGLFTSASADISHGLDNDLDSFVRYNLDGRYFWTPEPIPRLTWAFLGRVGYIDPTGDIEDVPDDQLFFLGGTGDVRGFKENMLLFDAFDDPLGGRLAVVGSLEARIDLGGDFELTTFVDAGRVKNTEVLVEDDDWRCTVGLGVRYVTPIGPVGFLYGFKLDRRDGESPGRLHFSIGYTF